MQTQFKSLKTPDGTVIHTFTEPGKNPVPHSYDGPAIKYPKSLKKSDEYFIFGIKYTKEQWLEAKNSAKVDFMPIDPNLG